MPCGHHHPPASSSCTRSLYKQRDRPARFTIVTLVHTTLRRFTYFIRMKVLLVVCALVVAALAYPQREGAQFTNEAIRQAQNTFLIPKDAEIQNVQEAIELSAYENIPSGQRIDLAQILGAHVPAEVVSNLQAQVDKVGV